MNKKNKFRYTERYKSHHDASRGLKNFFTVDSNKEDYLLDILHKESNGRRVVYVHVPFCNKICSFCPFHEPDVLKRSTYDTYVLDQIEKIKPYKFMSGKFDAINFGGGTPTSLKPSQLDKILKSLKREFSIEDNAEISIETTISELNDEMIDVFLQNKVNRLSIGVQTFRDDVRKSFNRRGTGDKVIETIKKVIEKGIKNTSVDLIYNYPNQTQEMLEYDLDIIKKLPIAGISFYSLNIHEKTPLDKQLTDLQRIKMSDTRNEFRLFSQIIDTLEPYGYKVLELTKLVRDNIDKYDYMNIRHNFGHCVPLGHGSGGNIGSYLYQNNYDVKDISEEVKISSKGRIVSDEYFIMDSLVYELQKGDVNLLDFFRKMNMDLMNFFSPIFEELENDKLIEIKNDGFTMTKEGLFWGNNIINEIIAFFLEHKVCKSSKKII